MSAPKIIKRYANRKLYDTERSCYVTLEDISMMIRAGDEVKVIDNKNGDDLTSVTLAQIIFETEKKNNFMPLGLLRDLIQNKSAGIAGAYREQIGKVQQSTQDLRENAQARADGIKQAVTTGINRANAEIQKPVTSAKELMASTQTALEEMQRNVEERFKGGVDTIGRELEQLRTKLSELEERLKGGDSSQQ